MSARERLSGMLWDNYTTAEKNEALDAYAHELAEKQRAHISDGRSEASWHRHHLYGLAGETFEAQAALDKLGESLVTELTALIDPESGP